MLIGPVKGQNIGCISKNTKFTSFCPQKDLLSLAHTLDCYKIPKVITIAMSWCSLNIICPVNYATKAVSSVWHYQNYRHFQCPFISLFSIQSGPFIIHGREHPLKISFHHVVSAFQIMVSFRHFTLLDNKLVTKRAN